LMSNPKHWWEVLELKEAYDIRITQLKKEMRDRFEKEFRVRVDDAPNRAYIKDA